MIICISKFIHKKIRHKRTGTNKISIFYLIISVLINRCASFWMIAQICEGFYDEFDYFTALESLTTFYVALWVTFCRFLLSACRVELWGRVKWLWKWLSNFFRWVWWMFNGQILLSIWPGSFTILFGRVCHDWNILLRQNHFWIRIQIFLQIFFP